MAEAHKALEKTAVLPLKMRYLLKLLDILTAVLERHSPDLHGKYGDLIKDHDRQRALLSMLKQQTDELDALKKLSIHLTSSLDLPDVLDAVVSEAMRLIENARDVNIFLYKNYKLSFGAALDAGRNPQQGMVNPQIQWDHLYSCAPG